MTRQIGVDAAVDVHVVPDGEPLVDRHYIREPATKVVGDARGELGRSFLKAQRVARDLQQPEQAARKIPVVLSVVRTHAVNVYRFTSGRILVIQRVSPRRESPSDSRESHRGARASP